MALSVTSKWFYRIDHCLVNVSACTTWKHCCPKGRHRVLDVVPTRHVVSNTKVTDVIQVVLDVVDRRVDVVALSVVDCVGHLNAFCTWKMSYQDGINLFTLSAVTLTVVAVAPTSSPLLVLAEVIDPLSGNNMQTFLIIAGSLLVLA